MNKQKYLKIAYVGILSALTFLCTAYVSFRILPNNGYLNGGNIIIVAAAVLFGARIGGLSGAIGSGLADLFFAPQWVIPTLFIKGALGLLTGIARSKKTPVATALYVAAGVVVAGGYYVAEAVIFGNWAAPLVSLPALVIEYFVTLVLGLLLGKRLSTVIKGLPPQD